jgi:hypothetical protein
MSKWSLWDVLLEKIGVAVHISSLVALEVMGAQKAEVLGLMIRSTPTACILF